MPEGDKPTRALFSAERVKSLAELAILIAIAVAISAILIWRNGRNVTVTDDAKAAGKTTADFPQTATHVFDEMDGGVPFTEDETKGRNTWLLWTAGDQVFWDYMAQRGFGIADLLKTLDSRQRESRFAAMGLINEPGYMQATQPDENGLWLDTGPQENDVDPVVYGRPSGVVGLRIYPNPKFDKTAQRAWNAQRYYSDPAYYSNPSLVRPYVVGMSCAFCHVSFNPLKPPDNPEHPASANLSSTIGNQYLIASKVFGVAASQDSYAYQLLHSWAPGTIDTSFLATDNLNNPSNMNPIYDLPARLSVAHPAIIASGALAFPGEQKSMTVPHILKDGADSVGLAGALSRVYVSIGEYSQEWLRDHNVIVGGLAQKPFEVAEAQKDSVYWQSTAERIPNLEKFLLKMSGAHLSDAPGGKERIVQDSETLRRGKIVFAENCAQCHSSKQPPVSIDRGSSQYADWMRSEVLKPDFLDDNFLSTEERIPVLVVQTNAARSLATNATAGHVWDNFSSQTYKALPSAGLIQVTNPFDHSMSDFSLPDGGPGYYRVPSLIGIWATAPFLHNNAIGKYTNDPSVSGRLAAYQDAMEKLLWPEKRAGVNSILRTAADSYIEIPSSYLPQVLAGYARDGFLKIGPIPAGTPINLLANADLDFSDPDKEIDRIKLIVKVQSSLLRIRAEKLSRDETNEVLMELVPDLLRISKCPDFIEDRGHLFGTQLSDADKRALIEFVKTF